LLSLLTHLANSSDTQYQRASAAIFAEITEKAPRVVDKNFLQPLCLLLHSSDEEVQRTASAAVGNLAILVENKNSIVEMNVVNRLLHLTASSCSEVQCNAAGCITNLVTDDSIKTKVINPPLLERLLTLTQVSDVRVSRNAIGALLNLTHSQSHRAMLLKAQAPYVLCHLLSHQDPDIIHYATTAISNMAVDDGVREMFADFSEFPSLLPTLIQLLNSPTPLRLQTQATLALRNLASSSSFQQYTIHSPALPILISHTRSEYPPLLIAAVACLRNLSICEDLTYRLQNVSLLDSFLDNLVVLVKYDGRVQSSLVQQLLATDGTFVTQEEVDEVQLHVISTIRNLAASIMDNKRLLMQRHLIHVFMSLVTRGDVSPPVLCEIGAVIAVLASDHMCRRDMLQENALKLVQKLCETPNSLEVIANGIAALANLAMRPTSLSLFIELLQVPSNANEALGTLIMQSDLTFKHLGLHCLDQLLQIRDPQIHSLLKPHIQSLHQPEFSDLGLSPNIASDDISTSEKSSSNLSAALDASSIPSSSHRSDSDTSTMSQIIEIKRLTEKIKLQYEI
ncbi:Vacuolar protein 8, partial [Coelomomyces lativittatus]